MKRPIVQICSIFVFTSAVTQVWAEEAKPVLDGKPLHIGHVGVGTKAPETAVVLLSGNDRSHWHLRSEKAIPSQIKGRTAEEIAADPQYIEMDATKPDVSDLLTGSSFGDARVHVEFYCPPGGKDQRAANSGVLLQDAYEIQVLGTSAEKSPLENNDCGSIYKIKAPDINAGTGPGTWQAYDIFFQAPRFDKEGKKTSDARETVYWNGKLVHNDIDIPHMTGHREKDNIPEKAIAPLELSSHVNEAEGNVRFRNIWVEPINATQWVPAGDWVNLFDGKTLDGWTPCGGAATYRAEDGQIIGTTALKTTNTFLCTKASYDNFELEYDARTVSTLNSGVQFRSQVDGGVDNRKGRVSGYQCEIDPSERKWSAGIYEEAKRSWLSPLSDKPEARAAYKADDWNHYHITCTGPVMKVTLNGVPAGEVYDEMQSSGIIGLQIHAVAEKVHPAEAKWRNIRLRPLKPE